MRAIIAPKDVRPLDLLAFDLALAAFIKVGSARLELGRYMAIGVHQVKGDTGPSLNNPEREMTSRSGFAHYAETSKL